MARPEIVAPGAADAVVCAAKSLWIAPDLWKTPQNSVSHKVLGRRTERAAHTLHRHHNVLRKETKEQTEACGDDRLTRY